MIINRILVVCIGNICRSPVGEVLLREHFKQQPKAPTIASAGLNAMIGYPAHELSVAVLASRGIDCNNHRAQQISAELVQQSDLILVMETHQQRRIESLFPQARGKVFRLGHWRDLDIEDPYGKPLAAFEKMLDDVTISTQDWIQKLS